MGIKTFLLDGTRLIEQRLKLRLTQKQAAERLGLPPAALCKLEGRRASFTSEMLYRVCQGYGCGMDQVVSIGEPEMIRAEREESSRIPANLKHSQVGHVMETAFQRVKQGMFKELYVIGQTVGEGDFAHPAYSSVDKETYEKYKAEYTLYCVYRKENGKVVKQ